MASASCFARGVDHLGPSSDELHLAPETLQKRGLGLIKPRGSCLAVRDRLLLMITIRDQYCRVCQSIEVDGGKAKGKWSMTSRIEFQLTAIFNLDGESAISLRLLQFITNIRMTSRWADSAEDAAEDARRKAEKEEKKRMKAEKQRKAQEAEQAAAAAAQSNGQAGDDEDRPSKRRRLSQDEPPAERKLLHFNAPSWQPCRSVERFDRLNHIEEGSYGYVSRAKEETTGEIVAIKKLKLDPARDGGFPVTALREIQTLNAAKHRHVVELREVVAGEGSAKGDVYLVMEFLEHDLKSLQEDMEEPFLPSEVKTLLLQLGSAVEYLHDNWILHRDLKTSNILMNNRGEIKVADFGMARFCGDPPPANLTQLVVTLWYRAPELLLGATTYDSAIDMWSIGCIFAELLTKHPLLQGKNEVDQLSKVSPTPQSHKRDWEEQLPKYLCL